MKVNYDKIAMALNVPVRLAMGFGVGLFVRKVTKTVTKDMSKPAKVATWFGAACTTWATAHAVDCWTDKAIQTCYQSKELSEAFDENEWERVV